MDSGLTGYARAPIARLQYAFDIGLREIIIKVQQRQPPGCGECIGEAVAIIERGYNLDRNPAADSLQISSPAISGPIVRCKLRRRATRSAPLSIIAYIGGLTVERMPTAEARH